MPLKQASQHIKSKLLLLDGMRKSSHSSLLLLVGALILAYCTSFLFVRPWAEFPVFDDWVYAKDCLLSAQAWHPILTHYESAWSIPQIIYGTIIVKVFGFSQILLRCTTCLAMVGAIGVLDLYLRRIGVHLVPRLITDFALAFHPFAYPQVVSFMTDIPFLFAWLGACYCWDRALEAHSTRWLIAATLATMVATAQRQFGVFIAAAVFLVILFQMRPSSPTMKSLIHIPARGFFWRFLISLAFMALFTIGVQLMWHFYLHGYRAQFHAQRALRDHVILTFVTINSLALSAWPLLISNRIGTNRLSPIGRALCALCYLGFIPLAIWFIVRGKFPLYQNVISEFGFLKENEVLLGQRQVIFGPMLNRIISFSGTVAFVLAVPRLVGLLSVARHAAPDLTDKDVQRSQQSTRQYSFGRVLITASVIYLLFVVYRGGNVFDRYTLPAIPGLFLYILKASPIDASMARRYAAVAMVIIFATVSITLTHDYFRWRESAWNAGESLVHNGIPAADIQAGYEWNGWKVGMTLFPDFDWRHYPYIISHSPLPEYQVIGVIPWESIWGPHQRQIMMLRRDDLGH